MKKGPSLYLAFLWHMHQPYYKDLVTGEYILPWVRLHGIKDYYDMVAILEGFPSIHQTFNLVPSLVEQLMDYASGRAREKFLELSKKPAAELTFEEKVFIVEKFFMANLDNMIKVYPRYSELLEKRGFPKTRGEVHEVSRYFSIQDFRDLQVWFNLSWFDPIFREGDPLLRGLVEKGRGFTEEEKEVLLHKQQEVLGLIVPTYKRLAENGQIELTASPYYHPILPLLCDTDSARVATPGISLPRERFSHPEDAQAQVSMAAEFHERVFGFPPRGMWPSEGAVSEDIIPILAGAGISWTASDKGVLACSLGSSIERDAQGRLKNPELLYKPYILKREGVELAIVFRDRYLSDLIGFTYCRWSAQAAVEDFMSRLRDIMASFLKRPEAFDGRPPLVTVILDGENAWEYYPNDGRDFLLKLYTRLSDEQWIKTVTVSEYLELFPPSATLPRLHAGSWINADFRIWIGQQEDNEAWELLSMVRNDLESFEASALEEKTNLSRAWKAIYVAEGSDWCWWYGDEHTSGNDEEFDHLFRQHLMNVYRTMDREVPYKLYIPILRGQKKGRLTQEPMAFIYPTIDGEVTNYFEWVSAGLYDVNRAMGAMHQSERIIKAVYFGFNLKAMFLRLDLLKKPWGQVGGLGFSLHFLSPKEQRIELSFSEDKITTRVFRSSVLSLQSSVFSKDKKAIAEDRGPKTEDWEEPLIEVAAKDIIELAIPFEHLGAIPGQEVQFVVLVRGNGQELERCPPWGYLSFIVPTEEFEAFMWQV